MYIAFETDFVGFCLFFPNALVIRSCKSKLRNTEKYEEIIKTTSGPTIIK